MTISAVAMPEKRQNIGQHAEVPDAEDLAGHFAQARAEGDAVAGAGEADDLGGVKAFGCADRADGVGVELGADGAQFEAPGMDGGAHAGGDAGVAGEDVVEAFLEQHRRPFLEPVQQAHGGRVGVGVGGIAPGHVADVEIGAGQAGVSAAPMARAEKTAMPRARGQHEALFGCR